jgi:hypothetical protein
MKQKQRPISALRLTAQACLLALSLSSASVVQATSATAPNSLEIAAEVAKAKKIAARTQAEKKRAIREALELENDLSSAESEDKLTPASNRIRNGSVNEEAFPDFWDSLAAATPDLSAHRIATETEVFIHATVSRLGLSAKASAGTAGFMVGMGGPWVYSQVMGTTVPQFTVLDSLALDAADAGVSYLEERYSLAERTGRASRYLMMAILAGGFFFVGHKTLSRTTARVSRRTPLMGKEPSDMRDITKTAGKGMFGFLGRKSSKTEEKPEGSQAIIVAFDIELLRDYAFNLLFARGRHDLAGVSDLLTPSLARSLVNHFLALEAKGHWNKVERVDSVKCHEVESWQDGGTSYAKLSVSWKALDYVVNFNRRQGEAGYIVEGDQNKMESFNEEWVVVRRAGEAWLVDAMYPSERQNLNRK